MKSKTIQVFDSPMCCTTGVCGPKVDQALVRFSSDIDWLGKQGIKVERYNLSSHPAKFMENATVKSALSKQGEKCLPLLLLDGEIVSRQTYPTREKLASLVGIESSNENVELACGHGCNCGSSTKMGVSNKVKYGIGISALVLAIALISIQGMKLKQTTTSNQQATDYTTANQTTVVKQPELPQVTSPVQSSPTVEPAQVTPPPVQSTEVKKYLVGEYLVSFNELNKVAMDKDTVFIYICADETARIPAEIEKAIKEAEKTLKANGLKIGIYTLSTSAPEYSGIAGQGTLPTIFVATKGKGSTLVKGTINGDNLLQAYTSTIKTAAEGGCCPTKPGGCG